MVRFVHNGLVTEFIAFVETHDAHAAGGSGVPSAGDVASAAAAFIAAARASRAQEPNLSLALREHDARNR